MWVGEKKIKLSFAGCHDFLVVNAGWTPSPAYCASSSTWSAASSSASRFDQGLVEENAAPAPTRRSCGSGSDHYKEVPDPAPAPSSSPSPSSAPSPSPAAAPSPSPAAALAPAFPAPSPPAPALLPVRVEAPAPSPAPAPTSSPSRSVSLPVDVRPSRRALFDCNVNHPSAHPFPSVADDRVARFRSEVRRIDECIKADQAGGKKKKKKRKRVDQIAARNLEQYALNEEIKIQLIGVVPGVEIGDTFCCRAEARLVGLHNHYMAGIGMIAHPLHRSLAVNVAASVVLNRGSYYPDNRDYGEVIVYSGQSGFAHGSKKQKTPPPSPSSSSPHLVTNLRSCSSPFPDDAMIDEDDKGGGSEMAMSQTPNRWNLALMNSLEHKLPVRVIRGYHGRPEFGRFKVLLSYDGLYMVTKSSYERGERGNYVYKFVMERLKNQPPIRFYDGVPVPPPPPELRLGSQSSFCFPAASCRSTAAAASSATRLQPPPPRRHRRHLELAN